MEAAAAEARGSEDMATAIPDSGQERMVAPTAAVTAAAVAARAAAAVGLAAAARTAGADSLRRRQRLASKWSPSVQTGCRGRCVHSSGRYHHGASRRHIGRSEARCTQSWPHRARRAAAPQGCDRTPSTNLRPRKPCRAKAGRSMALAATAAAMAAVGQEAMTAARVAKAVRVAAGVATSAARAAAEGVTGARAALRVAAAVRAVMGVAAVWEARTARSLGGGTSRMYPRGSNRVNSHSAPSLRHHT